MSSVSSDFCQFCHNESLPGHFLMMPALWLEKTVNQIVSPLPGECCDLIVSLVYRMALTVIALLAAIPVVLATVCFSLPGKAMASSCCAKKQESDVTGIEQEQSQEEEEEHVSVTIAAEPAQLIQDAKKIKEEVQQQAKSSESYASSESFNDIPTSSEQPSEEEASSQKQMALPRQLVKKHSVDDVCENVCGLELPQADKLDDQKNKDYRVVTVPPNGNCAFEAFMQEMKRLGHPIGVATISDFRVQTSDWIRANQANRDLAQLAVGSVEEYLEVKLQWKILTLEQMQLMPKIRNMDEEEVKAVEIQLVTIAQEKDALSLNLERAKSAAALGDIQDLFDEYLEAIKSDADTERVYASHAHYYAWSRMFNVSVNIEVYIERPWEYNMVTKIEAAQETPLTVCFLHKNKDHVDILIKN